MRVNFEAPVHVPHEIFPRAPQFVFAIICVLAPSHPFGTAGICVKLLVSVYGFIWMNYSLYYPSEGLTLSKLSPAVGVRRS
jgi:hypothetical protein